MLVAADSFFELEIVSRIAVVTSKTALAIVVYASETAVCALENVESA